MTDFLNQLVNLRGSSEPMPGPPVPDTDQGASEHAQDAAWLSFQAKLAAHKLTVVEQSGLFLEEYYLATYPDVRTADITPLAHFYDYGYKEGRRPNPYFEPLWYLERYPDIVDSGMQPLLHFVLHGDRQGRMPGPLFDTTWYRQRYDIPADRPALAHYLENRCRQPLSPMPDFDAEYYVEHNPDVGEARLDLFEHFVAHGYKECRNPSPNFDVKFYVQRYLFGDTETNPFLHFLENRHKPHVLGRLPDDEPTVSREVRRFTKPGPDFEQFRGLEPGAVPRVKLLAYYLPQFHAFPENDRWWGRGFTEWTNICRGSPRFVGHYQPRVPRDLGHYALTSNEPMRQQIDMAKAAGLYGLVFYYYWFNGKRLMDQPLERFLADPSLDINFALMWANENWTRRWDGAESEVLISQDYRDTDTALMAAAFAAHFRDKRYIRVQGRPLLMIYRPGLIPDTRKTIGKWRDLFRTEHGEDPIFVMAQSFGAFEPDAMGMDGAIEFPPHKLTAALPPANLDFQYLDFDFRGQIYHYDDVVRVSLEEKPPPFPLIKTAVPSWDNDARRQGTGIVVADSTPAKYESWLGRLVAFAEAHPFFGEKMVCINAWNEWCEGAYLEPDLHFGAAYLNATARAISGRPRRPEGVPRLVLAGHDAFPSGAQHLLLNIGVALRRECGVQFEFVLLDGGKLLERYEAVGPVTVVSSDKQLAEKLGNLARQGFSAVVINSSAAARVAPYAKAAGLHSVLQVHELPRLLREKHLLEHARAGLAAADRIVFAAAFVRDSLLEALNSEADDRMVIMPQGSYQIIEPRPDEAQAVRREFGLGRDDKLVLGVGYADLRKGFDLFLQLWRHLQGAGGQRICLAWVGGMDQGLRGWLADEIAAAEGAGTFIMAGYRQDMAAVFSAADGFALTSREDPFPTVVMEAWSVGLPVFAFDRSGGIADLLRETGQGGVAPYGDVPAMAALVATSLRAGITAAERARRAALVAERFDFAAYTRRLLRLALPELPRVSAAVPNYNYARFMAQRLGTIFLQTHPVFETIVLDDCSSDDSLAVIPRVAAEAGRSVRLVANERNSGSVFAQWRRAAELAEGDFLWIAEADDLADTGFLATLLQSMSRDERIVMGFTDSRTILLDGTAQWDSYKGYYASVEPGGLTQSEVFEGEDFARRFLSVKNLILNVSAVVWRRTALLAALDACGAELTSLRMAGDWRLYLQVLTQPGARLAYEAAPLNVHRRHAESVTHALDAGRHVAEIGQCHAVARDRLGLAAGLRDKQDVYAREVAAQLGAGAAKQPARRPAKGARRGG